MRLMQRVDSNTNLVLLVEGLEVVGQVKSQGNLAKGKSGGDGGAHVG